jgi:hypothetical protein
MPFVKEVEEALVRALRYCGALTEDSVDKAVGNDDTWLIASDGNCSMVPIQYDDASSCLVWSNHGRSAEAGLFLPNDSARLSEVVTGSPNQAIGSVVAVSTGERIAEVRKPSDAPALLMSLRVGGIIYPGSLVARLLFRT